MLKNEKEQGERSGHTAKWYAQQYNCWRAYNPVTKQFLHLSAVGETEGVTWAWRGTREQFKNVNQMLGGIYRRVHVDSPTCAAAKGYKNVLS